MQGTTGSPAVVTRAIDDGADCRSDGRTEMPGRPKLSDKLKELKNKRSPQQIPTGWWKDAKHRSQPPGSYLDPSLRRGPNDSSADTPTS